MKLQYLKSLVLVFVLLVSCNSDSESDLVLNEINLENKLTTLTEDEINDLRYLREEEKLARDVYLYSYNKYSLQIFNNISNSESQHMSSVLVLINKYNLEDPVSDNIGEFTNPDLQKLYNSLIEQSNISILEALKVGNLIEDMDIYDLEQNENRTSNLDLLQVYASLKCGSRNHLRNFNSLLLQYNGSYTPEFISNNDFLLITSSDNEKCGR